MTNATDDTNARGAQEKYLPGFEVHGPHAAVCDVWARLAAFDSEAWLALPEEVEDLERHPGGADAWLAFLTTVSKPQGLLYLRFVAGMIGVYTICSGSTWDYTLEKRAAVRDRFVDEVVIPIVDALGNCVTVERTLDARDRAVRPL